MKLARIDSIEDLRRERARLKIEADVARQGIEKQIKYTVDTAEGQVKEKTRQLVSLGSILRVGIGVADMVQQKRAQNQANAVAAHLSEHDQMIDTAYAAYRRYRSPNGKGWLEWLPLAKDVFKMWSAQPDAHSPNQPAGMNTSTVEHTNRATVPIQTSVVPLQEQLADQTII